MSGQTDTVRRAHQALNEGDIDALVSVCDPQFRLDMSDRVFNPEVYEGHHGIRRFYAEVTDVWESFTWEPIELQEVGNLVVAVVHSKGKGRGSGLALDRRSSMLWQMRGDIAVALTFYRDPGEALAVARRRAQDE